MFPKTHTKLHVQRSWERSRVDDEQFRLVRCVTNRLAYRIPLLLFKIDETVTSLIRVEIKVIANFNLNMIIEEQELRIHNRI